MCNSEIGVEEEEEKKTNVIWWAFQNDTMVNGIKSVAMDSVKIELNSLLLLFGGADAIETTMATVMAIAVVKQ